MPIQTEGGLKRRPDISEAIKEDEAMTTETTFNKLWSVLDQD